MKKYLIKNWSAILWGVALLIVLFHPGAKAWVLRQVMRTGVFNAEIKQQAGGAVAQFSYLDEGVVAHVQELRGKVVFINFGASWCPPCRAELPTVVALYEKMKDNPGVKFLFFGEDNDPAAAREFLKGLPMVRNHGDIPEYIYKGTLPTTVILDKRGVVRYHHEGLADFGTEQFMEQLMALTKE